MKKYKVLLFAIGVSGIILTSATLPKKSTKLKFQYFKSIKVPEPSDIAIDHESDFMYVVSDNGLLFECKTDGTVIRKAAFEGMDFEGVEVHGNFIYVADESLRQIHKFDKATLEKVSSSYVPYSGGRNKGYESLTFNQTSKKFIVITEKDPIIIKELNQEMVAVNEYKFTAARDISAARWHNGFMYLLSDEDRKIFKCDPISYEILQSWTINVLNPEGIAFDKNGKLVIAADDLQRLYFFDVID